MGSQIAAHFANIGIPALLLDLPSSHSSDRSELARSGLKAALEKRPSAFYIESTASLIETGNFEDDLGQIAGCDWVIEAVAENLEVKKALWALVDKAKNPDAVLSTNTSGIRLSEIARDLSPDFRRNFLGTHFFNPPRYLHLLEVIPGTETDAEIVSFVQQFGEEVLGKGIVVCKDTPNFIANRIGSFFSAAAQRKMVAGEYSIEEVDALTGPLLGLPKSATFRLIDIIGLDVWASVSNNIHASASDDLWREWFALPDYQAKMIERGWLGEKAGQGFYRRAGKGQFEAIDWKTLDYHPAKEAGFESVAKVRKLDLPERLRTLLATEDRAGLFLRRLLHHYFAYSAAMVPEISGRIVEIDRAMRWGYAHQLGPFELWDAIGFQETARKMETDGVPLPGYVHQMLKAGAASFYRPADKDRSPHTKCFDFRSGTYQLLEQRPGVIALAELKRARGVVKTNAAASLIDLGDGVLCLEFHSKMNAIEEATLQMIEEGFDELAQNFEAMVIANQGVTFSAGANLAVMGRWAEDSQWNELEQFIARFQQCTLRLKYAPKPVVAAPFSRVLGGGCEVVLHSHRVQAAAELNIGLVEVSVGLIPAAGGCKEMVLRFPDSLDGFRLILHGKVSGSAAEALQMELLQDEDRISINPERLVGDAKAFALELAKIYQPGTPLAEIGTGGAAAYEQMQEVLQQEHKSNQITDYDRLVGEKLAYVLSGGETTTVSEQRLLDLEREVFLSLCGNIQTQERIQYMLKNGKPLKN